MLTSCALSSQYRIGFEAETISVAATPAADAGTSVELPDLSRLRCGQRVEVFWKAEKEWFPGLWVADAGRGEGAGAGCGVLYEDGESETVRVPRQRHVDANSPTWQIVTSCSGRASAVNAQSAAWLAMCETG
ncbi:hypothetical protein CYMTET_8923 [Cymbomonas tetramitiformis]|uniref:Uncharacterized protein n=1 Tax=Cymbomonas tetramitiformis TaxID=36881 RepID=A0AAE0GS19_9CHLO|nr:hypothetical protein CYMTET_8923 [Cymbomonas tetramitiformis]